MSGRRKTIGRTRNRCALTRAACRGLESLEARQLLAGTEPFINEFLASNGVGITDDYQQHSDWIEIYNPTASAVNLAGWHLTDNKSQPGMWTFPSGTSGTTIPAGGYLVVFADNRANAVGPGGRLHTNFSLKTEGEYLALTRPDSTVVNAFDNYPPQATDISYGSVTNTPPTINATVVRPGNPSKTFIPTNGSLNNTWTGPGFDDSTWIPGSTGVGFEVPPTVNQFRTRMVDTSTGSFSNIAQATTLLDGNTSGFSVAFDGSVSTNTLDFGDPGSYAGTNPMPNGVTTNTLAGREQYAMRSTANITIPAGTWTIAVNSDAGFRLTIPGVTFTSRLQENYTGVTAGVQPSVLVYGGVRTAGLPTLGTFTVTGAPLTTTLQLDYFETTGADLVELSVAAGTQSSHSTSTFSLLQNGVVPPGATDPFQISSTQVGQYAGLLATNVPQMQNANASAYVRVPFQLDNLDDIAAMTLRMKYDDGYVAYLNGTEIARRNAPGAAGTPLPFDAAASSDRLNAFAVVFEDVDVTAFKNLLVPGQNVLAFQALNSSAANNDLLLIPQLDVKYAVPSGLQYMATPSPGSANLAGALGISKDTHFSVDRGFYDDPFDVVISSKQSGAAIYYTKDGRNPVNADGSIGSTAIRYTGPIHVTTTTNLRAAALAPGYLPSDVDTQTYIFLKDVIHQPNQPAGFPTSWVDQSGVAAPGTTGTLMPGAQGADYEMDPQVVNDPRYSADLINDLKSIPSVSITMNVDDLFGNGPSGTNGIKGIYSNPTAADANGTTLWERATSMEMLFPDGDGGFQIDAGIQIQGNASREQYKSPKHGFRVLFKDRYGPTQLDYKVFDDTDTTHFDALILKGLFGNSWVHWDPLQRKRTQFVHDQFTSDTELAMGNIGKHGRFVFLYLNGLFWGLYALTERPEGSFASQTVGGPQDDYDVVANEGQLVDGNLTAWNQMFTIANGPGGAAAPTTNWLADNNNYNQLKQYLDIPSFINYILLNTYGGNNDWDDHNWYAFRRSRNDGTVTNQYGGFHFIVFDSERLWESVNDNKLSINNSNRPTRLFQQLRANAEFRQQFADAVHKHLFNGGALTPAQMTARYLGETAKVEAALAPESARWGDYRRDVHQYQTGPYELYTPDLYWYAERNRLTVDDTTTGTVGDSYFKARPAVFLSQLRSAGLYPTIDAPELNQFGGNVAPGFLATLTIPTAAPAGTVIYYTTDGSDPRLTGGGVNPAAIQYAGAFAIDASTRIRARAYNPSTQTWTALTDATFFVAGPPKLRVTEMMYNPVDGPGPIPTYPKDDYEFIELQNTGATDIDPAGIHFTDGIDFTFPVGSPLIPAGGRVVLVRNPLAFQERYGNAIPIAGTYTGELSDSGERISLATGLDQSIESFVYKDGWFDQTDGEGFSLVAINPDATDATLSTKDAWRSGQSLNGNPGGADPGLANNSIVINEVLPTATGGATNWIEFKNTTGASIDIGGWFLSDDKLNRQKFTIPAGTVVPANGFWSISQDGAGGFGTLFTLSSLGGAIFLTSNDGPTAIGGYRDAIDYGASDPGVSFGKYVKSTGGSDFTALSAPTRNAANAYPKVGPVVINEIMYNPFGTDREFVEIRNITDAPVSLAGWTFSDGINFTFGVGASIAADGYALIVPIDPALYRSTYNVPASVAIFGPYTGGLDSAGEKLTLAKPGTPVGDVTPFIAVDRVNYDNEAPWPASPDGDGPSVARLSAIKYGNDVANWRAETTSGSGGAPNNFAPTVYANAFAYAAGPAVTIKFSKDVGASLTKGDLSLLNQTTAQPLDLAAANFVYDPATQTATWTLLANLPDGNYRATIAAADVTDAQNRPLDANGDGTAGDDLQFDFYHLGGDANGDRSVDFNDLVKLAQNYNSTGNKTWADGDFTFDGNVDFNDLVVLAQRYNTSLPAAGDPVAAAGAPLDPVAFAESLGFAVPTAPKPKPPVRPTPIVHKPSPKPVAPAKSKLVSKNVAPRRVVSNFSLNRSGGTQSPAAAVVVPPPPTAAVTSPFAKKKVQQGLF